MSEVDAVSANNAVGDENNQIDKSVKSRKSKSPRSATKEENEPPKGEVEGRRITRSAAKGAIATPPPPAKKERKSTPAKGRGRPKKGGSQNTDESDSHDESKDVIMTEAPSKVEESKKEAVENNSHEEKEELANNNAEAETKESEATENGAKEDTVDASTSEEKKEEKSETSEEKAESSATEADEKPAE